MSSENAPSVPAVSRTTSQYGRTSSVTFATPTPSPAALIMERSFAESPTAMTSDIGIPSISARRVSPITV